jgi:hypothetical protein
LFEVIHKPRSANFPQGHAAAAGSRLPTRNYPQPLDSSLFGCFFGKIGNDWVIFAICLVLRLWVVQIDVAARRNLAQARVLDDGAHALHQERI